MVKLTDLKITEDGRYQYNTVKDQVYVKNGCIVIDALGDHCATQFPLSDLNTHEKLVNNIINQTTKAWMTTEIIHRFFILACKENGLNTWYNCVK